MYIISVLCCFSFLFFSYSESDISGQTTGIRTSIYYTRPTIQRDVTAPVIAPRTCDTTTKSRPPLTPLQPSNVDSTSAISQSGSCIKKKVAWADQGKQSLFNHTNYTNYTNYINYSTTSTTLTTSTTPTRMLSGHEMSLYSWRLSWIHHPFCWIVHQLFHLLTLASQGH